MPNLEFATNSLRGGDLANAFATAEAGLEALGPSADDYWRFLFVKAECLRMRGQTRQALELLGIDDRKLSPEICALWRMHRAYFLGMRNSYVEAKQGFDEAEKIANAHDLKTLRIEILLRRAMILFFAEDLDASQETYRTALELAHEHEDKYLEAVALAGTGKNLMIRGNFQEAIGWYERAFRAATDAGARLLAATMNSELGWCYYNLKNDSEALRLFRLSETVFIELGALHHYQISLGNIGNIFVRSGDYPTAIAYFQRALEIAKKIEDRISMEKWLNNLASVFFKLGNPVSAGEYQRQAMRLKQEIQLERDRARSTS